MFKLASRVIKILLVGFLLNPLIAQGDSEQRRCDIGPLKKAYGRTNWLVYSCSDEKTLIFVSDAGSPVMPFVFALILRGDEYELSGEGATSRRDLTGAAFDEIKILSKLEIDKMINLTKKIKASEADSGK